MAFFDSVHAFLDGSEDGGARNGKNNKESTSEKGKSVVEQALRRVASLAEGEHAESFSKKETVSGKQVFSYEDIQILTDVVKELSMELQIDYGFDIQQYLDVKIGATGKGLRDKSTEVLTDSGRTITAIMDEGQAALEVYDLAVDALETAVLQSKFENDLINAATEEDKIALIRKTDPQCFADGAFLRKLLYSNESPAVAEAIVMSLPQRVSIDHYDLESAIFSLSAIDTSLALNLISVCTLVNAALHSLGKSLGDLLKKGATESDLCDALSRMDFVIDSPHVNSASFAGLPASLWKIVEIHMIDNAKSSILKPETAPKTRNEWEAFLGNISKLISTEASKLILYLNDYPDLQERVFRTSAYYRKAQTSADIVFAINLIEENCQLNGDGELISNGPVDRIHAILDVLPYVPQRRDQLVAELKTITETEKKLASGVFGKDFDVVQAANYKAQKAYMESILLAKSAALEKIPTEEKTVWLFDFRYSATDHLLNAYEHGHAEGVIEQCNLLSPQALAVALSGKLTGNIFFTAPLEALAKKAGGPQKIYEVVRPVLLQNGMLTDFLVNVSSRGRLAELVPDNKKVRQTYLADFAAILNSNDIGDMDRFFSGIDKIIQDTTIGAGVQEVLLRRYKCEVNEEKRTALGFAILKAWHSFNPEVRQRHEKEYNEIRLAHEKQLADMDVLPGNEWMADGKITIKKIFTPGRILDFIKEIQKLLPEDKREEAALVIFKKHPLKTALRDNVFDSLSPEEKRNFEGREYSIQSDLEHQEGYLGASVYELIKEGNKVIEGSFKIINAAKGLFQTSDRVVLARTVNGVVVETICEKSFDPQIDFGSAFADPSIDMIELRSHCWDIDEAFMQAKNSPSHKKAVLIGACGGFGNVGSILAHHIDGIIPQFMGTAGEGYGPINQELSGAIIDAVTSGNFQTWAQVGEYARERLDKKFSSPENKARLARYVLPGSFSSMMTHLKAYTQKAQNTELALATP